MDEIERNFEEIERFLSGELTKDQKNAFENKLQCDQAFREDYELHQELQNTIGEDGLLAFRQKVKNVVKKEKEADFKNSYYGLKMAAAVLILVVISFTIYQYLGKTTLTDQQIVSEFFEPYDNLLAIRGNAENPLQKAMSAYNMQEYQLAIELFSNIPIEEDYLVPFYQGISFLALHDGENAVKTLELAKVSCDPSFVFVIDWYLSMANLLNNEEAKCIELLENLKNGDSSYAIKAGELLNKVEKR